MTPEKHLGFWILDPAEYRIFGYIRLCSGGSWIQDFPKESLKNLGSWIRPNIEYSAKFRNIQEVLKKSGGGMDI